MLIYSFSFMELFEFFAWIFGCIIPILDCVLFIIFFLSFFKLFRLWFLWPITCAIFGFFIDQTFIIIIKSKMCFCRLFYTFKFFCILQCGYIFNYIIAIATLAISVVFYIISLYFIFYIGSFFKLLFLLWSLFKLLLLRSLVQLLLPQFLTIRIPFFRFPLSFIVSPFFRFFGTTKVHQFQSTIPLLKYLLQCFLY